MDDLASASPVYPARPPREKRVGSRGAPFIAADVKVEARRLLEGLSFAAVSARTGVSRTTLCRWTKTHQWVRPARPGDDTVKLPRYRRRGRPYAADAVGRARTLFEWSLLPQKAIAAQVGISQERVSAWARARGWERLPKAARRGASAVRHGPLATEGDRRGRPYAPETRREARVLWEDTRLGTALIGARLRVHPATVARWAKAEGWVRPRGRTGARQLRGYFGRLARG